MTKRKSIISFEKLSLEQKKNLERDFPEGFLGNLTTIKTPKGETLDALIWETEEMIYLVKINKEAYRSSLDEEEEEFIDDSLSSDIQVDDEDAADDDDDDDDSSKDEDDDEDEDDEE